MKGEICCCIITSEICSEIDVLDIFTYKNDCKVADGLLDCGGNRNKGIS